MPGVGACDSQGSPYLTVSRAFLKKLETVRLALSHSMTGADAEDILSAGLDLLLERDAKRKGLVEKPRSAPANVPEAPGAVGGPTSDDAPRSRLGLFADCTVPAHEAELRSTGVDESRAATVGPVTSLLHAKNHLPCCTRSSTRPVSRAAGASAHAAL